MFRRITTEKALTLSPTILRRFQSSLNTTSTIHQLSKTPNKYNDKNSAFNFRPNYPKNVDGETIFFNPAPSAPTPTKTPNAFLPANDPRKGNPLYNTELNVPLEYMPELRIQKEKTYHMTSEEISKLQELRDQGLKRRELMNKFNVSNLFISLSTDPNQELLQKRNAKLDKFKKRWSKEKIAAKESKSKRVSMWLRDEY